MRLAAIDVGTNTIRLLIADVDRPPAGYRTVVAVQEMARLGQDLFPGRTLKQAPVRRSLDVLTRFGALARAHGAERVRAVGTGALREAANREDFLAAARERGVDIQVVSGEEEARLTLLGVRAGLGGLPEPVTMLDIGGGSTELLACAGGQIRAAVSLELGSVGLTEACLRADPPGPGELAALRRAVEDRLAAVPGPTLAELLRAPVLVGTAGTITTLAAIDLGLPEYDAARVSGRQLRRDRIEELLHQLVALPLADRRHLAGLEPGRADVIVAGTVICLGVMQGLGFTQLVVSDGGLREGILLDGIVC